MQNLCMTRWIQKINFVSSIIPNFESTFNTFTTIINKNFDSNMTYKTNKLIIKMKNSKFIISLLTLNYIMSSLKCLTLYLQSISSGLSEANNREKSTIEIVE